jgi:2-polyprenyl-3-methyl-5-hydroxy-6-metoxy-1,4-benzoquinol methylase
MTTTELDQAKAEAFAGRMVTVINDAALALSVSVGHRTGLFDTLAGLRPSTSEEIANASGCNERYVREWLGAMVAGRVVEYEPTTSTYRLPAEHAASLTRAAGVANFGAIAQMVAMLGGVETQIVGCFQDGGGVPYSEFPTFHAITAELSKDTVDATLLDRALPLVPGLVGRLEAGIDVADVGCGSGYALCVMARAFPDSRFHGFDFSEEAVTAARTQARVWKLDNATFEVRDVTDLSPAAAYDFITTFDAVHDQAAPDRVLAGIAAALRPGGVYVCVDIAASSNVEDNTDHPLGSFLYTISTMHCMTVSLALDGMGLGTVWGEQTALAMLSEAGFANIKVEHVPGDIFNVYYVAQQN